MEAVKEPSKAGRPRAFDVDAALETAIQLFWKNGYEGVSISDLTEAIGVNRPSLYAAFGNKEELFKKAFDRYCDLASCVNKAARKMPTAREAVASLLFATAEAVSHPDHPGCLSVVGALSCSQESEAIRQELSDVRRGATEVWKERFEQARQEGDLPEGADPEALALFLMTVVTGMSVQARSGATAEQLKNVAELALKAWPACERPKA